MLETYPIVTVVISLFGLWTLFVRVGQNKVPVVSDLKDFPLISIIIPCRNEEKRLTPTLESILKIDYPHKEIIVVDDHSEDRTFEIASAFPITVLKAPVKTPEWSGKNGACWAGAEAAQGDYLLFTDADTFHQSSSLKKVMAFALDQEADLVSAPPFHLCRDFYEKYLGLFWLFPLIASAFFQKPKPHRLFAIGQYLFFKRSSYFDCGGHKAIASELVDDVALASRIVSHKRRLVVYPATNLFSVQMYDGFLDFVKGWVRLIRLGLGKGSLQAFIEVASVCHLFAAAVFNPHPLVLGLFVLGVFVLMKVQSLFAQVRGWTAFLAPFSVLVFTALTVIAIAQTSLRRGIVWRGRRY